MTGEEAKPSYSPVDGVAAGIALKQRAEGGTSFVEPAGWRQLILAAQTRINGEKGVRHTLAPS